MNSLLLNDDILYYLKGHIYINDYDKMKNVSIKHRDLFNLKPILYNKHYDILLTIRGVSIENIFDIIDLNIRNKYKFKKNKTIKKKLLKYSSLLEICINNKNVFVIEYLIDIIYNTSKKKFDNIISTINHLYNKDELYSIPPTKETCGETNRIIGRWLKKTKKRDQIIIADKVVGRSGMNWIRPGEQETRLSKKQINSAIENSLRNLQIDHIDIYQLHWPDRPLNVFSGLEYEQSRCIINQVN